MEHIQALSENCEWSCILLSRTSSHVLCAGMLSFVFLYRDLSHNNFTSIPSSVVLLNNLDKL